MSTHQFAPGNHFRWCSRPYVVLERFPKGVINLKALDDNTVVSVPEDKLLQGLLHERSLSFELALNFQAAGTPKELCEYPQRSRNEAIWRLSVIEPFLTVTPLPTKVIAAHIEALHKEPTSTQTQRVQLSVPTVRRWLRAYREGHENLLALVPKWRLRGGSGQVRQDSATEQTIQDTLQTYRNRGERITAKDLHLLVIAELMQKNKQNGAGAALSYPSKSTILRRVHAFDLDHIHILTRSRRAKEVKQVVPGPIVSEPLQRVEVDHWKSDLIVVDDLDNLPLGRLTLTYALDCYSRYPLGYYLGFEPPSLQAVAACLHHAVMPKGKVQERYRTQHPWLAYGLPATVVVDNGREFTGRNFAASMGELGVTVERCPMRTPEFKGTVERAFRSLGEGLFHALPGTTLAKVLDRQGYDSAAAACIPLAEIDRILHLHLLDLYAESYHRGLNAIPARTWERALGRAFLPMLPSSAKRLEVALGEQTERRIFHYGIDWDNLRYQSPELGALRYRHGDRKTTVRRVRDDLSRIYAHDAYEERWIEVLVVAPAQEYARGLSLWKHRVVLALLKEHGDKVDIEALARAKRGIQDIVDASRARTPSLKTRSRVARWSSAGKPTRTLEGSEADSPKPQALPERATPAPSEPVYAEPDAPEVQPSSQLSKPPEGEWEIAQLPSLEPPRSPKESV